MFRDQVGRQVTSTLNQLAHGEPVIATPAGGTRSRRFQELLPSLFIRECRRRLFSPKVADSTGVRLTGGSLLAATLVLRRILARYVLTPGETNVGVLLPPSVGAVLANTSLALSHKVAVNLNYTFPDAMIDDCVRRAGVKHVLTSRSFLRKRPTVLNAELVCLEDLEARATLPDKARGLCQAYLFPAAMLQRQLGLQRLSADQLLTILFTSGTTGEPKGVMLSQRNVAANIEGIRELFRFSQSDVVLGVLPFFHAFGYTLGLWAVLAIPLAGVYHYNPLGAGEVGRLCQQHKATVLETTPTFLRLYLKRCQAEQLSSLDMAVVGGERLPLDLARAFADRFGVVPTEGYGATELSPLAIANVPENRKRQNQAQPSLKLGTVGRPLPGVKVKIVDPATGAPLDTNREGLLFVQGDNVMQGYLNDPDRTAAVIRDGWYDTGDLARVDEEGFVEILGRQSRFSKIGGEMVPHAKIEETLESLLGGGDSEEIHFAVTAVPDEARGERLLVLHRPLPEPISDVVARLGKSGLPRLWIPDEKSFVQVAKIPLRPMGKIDLGAVRHIAESACKAGS
jgi:acyl-[acyl-carrier-protein]-phospholipid O-acyltransferase/long-chain-fatty-acid--[acyl-carrier-protein] ligase